MSTIASRKVREPRFSVYQLGLGSEPMMVVGSTRPLVAFSTEPLLSTRGVQLSYTQVRYREARGNGRYEGRLRGARPDGCSDRGPGRRRRLRPHSLEPYP